MTHIDTAEREGIRELTSEEIATVSGGYNFLSCIEQKICCIVQQILSCLCGSRGGG